MEISTIGLGLAKNVFQVHGVSATGEVVLRKTLRRAQVLPFFAKLPPCLAGAEACGTSHHLARELTKLGHEVRLMPASYVKPYVKRSKNDAADADTICEAVTRQTTAPDPSPDHHFMLATREPATDDIWLVDLLCLRGWRTARVQRIWKVKASPPCRGFRAHQGVPAE